MGRWLRALFAWRTIREAGVYAYEENQVTGRRRARRIISGGFSPLARRWLDGGAWDDHGPPPNVGGGGQRR